MSVPYRDRSKYVRKAIKAGITPGLLAWRIRMGFPAQHIDATEMEGDRYIYGRFDQGFSDDKKPEKTSSPEIPYPQRAPAEPVPRSEIQVTYRKSRLKK